MLYRGIGIITYLVAMALGKYVIITDGPGSRGILENGEHCLIVPPRDPAMLRTAILQINGDVALRRDLARAGYNYAMACGDSARLYLDFMRCIRSLVDVSHSVPQVMT